MGFEWRVLLRAEGPDALSPVVARRWSAKRFSDPKSGKGGLYKDGNNGKGGDYGKV